MLTALVVALTVVVALLGVLVAGLLRSHADILRQLHALGAGRTDGGVGPVDVPFGVQPQVAEPTDRTDVTAHDLAGVSLDDDAIGVAVVGTRNATLLAFLSSGCSTCSKFWATLRKSRDLGLPAGVRVVVVTKGPDQESAATLRDLAPAAVPVVMSNAAWDDYGVPGSPFFVLVDGPTGRIVGEGSATAWSQVVDLLRTSLADGATTLTGQAATDAGNAPRIDAELEAAGIGPGHPSLYPEQERP